MVGEPKREARGQGPSPEEAPGLGPLGRSVWAARKRPENRHLEQRPPWRRGGRAHRLKEQQSQVPSGRERPPGFRALEGKGLGQSRSGHISKQREGVSQRPPRRGDDWRPERGDTPPLRREGGGGPCRRLHPTSPWDSGRASVGRSPDFLAPASLGPSGPVRPPHQSPPCLSLRPHGCLLLLKNQTRSLGPLPLLPCRQRLLHLVQWVLLAPGLCLALSRYLLGKLLNY